MRSDRLAIMAIAVIVLLAGLFLLGAVLIGAWFDRRNDTDDLGLGTRPPGTVAYATAGRASDPARSFAAIPARIS
jgi:hypothetical protein